MGNAKNAEDIRMAKLNVYLIERDDWGYDEVVAMCVVAESIDKAMEIAARESWYDWKFDQAQLRVKKIDLTMPGMILAETVNG